MFVCISLQTRSCTQERDLFNVYVRMFVWLYVFLWRCKLLCTLRRWIITTCARKPFLDAFNFLRDGSSMKAVGKHPKKYFVVVLALFAKVYRFGPSEVGIHVNR